MKLTVLGSGSTGNAILIVAGETRVLVDAGLSAKEIARRLALVGEDVQRLDAVLVTHEHGDHAGGLRVLLRTVDCPVYISAQTCDAYISERTNVLTAPLQSVVLRAAPPAGERTGVFLLADGQAQFAPVSPGAIGGLDIEVSGVPEGAQIIVGPYQTLRDLKDGTLVRASAAAR